MVNIQIVAKNMEEAETIQNHISNVTRCWKAGAIFNRALGEWIGPDDNEYINKLLRLGKIKILES